MNRHDESILTDSDGNPVCKCGNRGSRPGERINMTRVRQRLDQLQDEGDLQGAERMLDYWLAESRMIRDEIGEIEIENEYIGFFRKAGKGEEALKHAERALLLIGQTGMENSIIAATTRINSATACVAFQQTQRAWSLFNEARNGYEALLKPEDSRLAGLYNNMGLAATELGRYGEAKELYEKALEIVTAVPGHEGDAAITWLNMADLVHAEGEASHDEEKEILAAEQIDGLIDKAWTLLQSLNPTRNDYDRFVCEKCAPVFGYYGYLDYEQQLRNRSSRPPKQSETNAVEDRTKGNAANDGT